jgi:hypothetical protein
MAPKNTEKTVRKELKNVAKCRFSEGIDRHFAAPAADVARTLPASQTDLTSCVPGRGA